TAPAAVPAGLLLRARQLAETRAAVPGRPAWRWGAVAAATAGLMVIAAISLREPRTPVTPPAPASSLPAAPAAPTPATSRTIRREQRKAAELQLIFPREGSVLSRSEVEFRWKSVRGSQFYEIRVVTAEGDVVWEGRVETTQARLPDNIELAPGREYFVSVRAYLPEGKTLKSPTVGFSARHPG
ncbi:MAG: fibronectin type III domain-containing protein, partial [Acidobacteriia bacterium]|nr:fibronectin type III domain-containing protein [Terriglobia bacterium]